MATKKTTPIVKEVKEEVVITPEQEIVIEAPKYLVVTADALNVRKEPSKESEILTVVNKNEKLLANSFKLNKGFYAITTPTGISGYVMKDFVVEE